MENQERVREWVAGHFNVPANVQVPLITDGEDNYPESHDTVSVSASSGAPTQVNEITSTAES